MSVASPTGTFTEDEAKAKDCPAFRHVVNENGVVHDLESAIYVPERCRAGGCVAWREHSRRTVYVVEHDDKVEEFSWDPRKHQKETYGGFVVKEERTEVLGYCGLGGKP